MTPSEHTQDSVWPTTDTREHLLGDGTEEGNNKHVRGFHGLGSAGLLRTASGSPPPRHGAFRYECTHRLQRSVRRAALSRGGHYNSVSETLTCAQLRSRSFSPVPKGPEPVSLTQTGRCNCLLLRVRVSHEFVNCANVPAAVPVGLPARMGFILKWSKISKEYHCFMTRGSQRSESLPETSPVPGRGRLCSPAGSWALVAWLAGACPAWGSYGTTPSRKRVWPPAQMLRPQ